MADNDKNKQSNESSSGESNPMKSVITTQLPTKREYEYDQSKENAEKRNKE